MPGCRESCRASLTSSLSQTHPSKAADNKARSYNDADTYTRFCAVCQLVITIIVVVDDCGTAFCGRSLGTVSFATNLRAYLVVVATSLSDCATMLGRCAS